jgi:hypothetical protein
MLQQPRVPSTGSRQAVEIYIKWQEVISHTFLQLPSDVLSRQYPFDLDLLKDRSTFVNCTFSERCTSRERDLK